MRKWRLAFVFVELFLKKLFLSDCERSYRSDEAFLKIAEPRSGDSLSAASEATYTRFC
jgi:hypothetical protein